MAWELQLIGSPRRTCVPLLGFLFLLPPVRVPPKPFGRDSNTNNLITCFQRSEPIRVFILFPYFHFILLKEYATSIKEIYFQQSGEESKPDGEYSTSGATRGSNCVTNRLHCSYCLQDKVY